MSRKPERAGAATLVAPAPYIQTLYLQACAASGESEPLKDLRDLSMSALLQLERLKEELHRLAPTTADVRTQRMLVHTTELVNAMRHGG